MQAAHLEEFAREEQRLSRAVSEHARPPALARPKLRLGPRLVRRVQEGEVGRALAAPT